MKRMILVTGDIFFLLLLGFVYVCEHADVTSLTDLCNLQFGTGMGLSALEKSYYCCPVKVLHGKKNKAETLL